MTLHNVALFACLWLCLLSLSLTIYRFSIKEFINPIMLSIVPLTFISLLVQHFKVASFITIIQPAAMAACLIFIFQFRIFNAIIMTSTAYILALPTEFISAYIINYFHWEDSISEIQSYELTSAWLAMVLIAGMILVLVHFRLGFSIITQSYHSRNFINQNKPTFITYVYFVMIITSITSLFVYHLESYFFYFFILLIITAMLLVILTYKRDLES